jgi:NADPH:quinone reductase-like Zn-dependent oxidoreductase
MRHRDAAVDLIRPRGDVDDADRPMPMVGMKMKAASLHWEFMFARPTRQTPDMIEQHKRLTYVVAKIDAGRIRPTLGAVLRPINAANIRAAPALIDSGRAKGKIVGEGWED